MSSRKLAVLMGAALMSALLAVQAVQAQEALTAKDFSRDSKFLKRADPVAVPGYRVILALVDGTYAEGRAGAGARADIGVHLQGVDPALLQELTEAGYQDFMTKLAATNRPVIPLEAITAVSEYQALEKKEAPYIGNVGGREVAIGSPAALPLFFGHFDLPFGDVGPMTLGPVRAMNAISVATKAVVVIPEVSIHFVDLERSGRSNASNSASVGASPNLRIMEDESGMKIMYAKIKLAGDIGLVWGQKPIPLDSTVGQLVTLDEQSNEDSLDPTGFFQERARVKLTGAYQVDPERFKQEVLRGIYLFNDGLIAAINQ